MSINPSASLAVSDRLTFLSLEIARHRAGLDFDWIGETWAPTHAPVQAIQVDLSSVTFMQLRALVALVIVVGSAVEDGADVEILPPVRDESRRFLQAARFADALRDFPGKQLVVHYNSPDDVEPARYARMFPLTWATGTSLPRGFLTSVLSRDLGDELGSLPVDTAQAISGLVTQELLENVAVHARAPAALVAAMTAVGSFSYGIDDLLPTEQAFRKRNTHWHGSVQLCVADAGAGIANTMRTSYQDMPPAELIDFAFDRWSTSAQASWRRGTRGLYRIERIAKKSEGFVTARSGRDAVTRLPSTNEHTNAHQFGTKFPGTLVYVELPIDSLDRSTPGVALSHGVGGPPPRLRVRLMDSMANDDLFYELASSDGVDDLVVLDFSNLRCTRSEAIDLVRRLSEMTHPRPCSVVGLPFDDFALEQIALDVNDELARDHPGEGLTELHEPVLLVGSSFRATYWAGTHPELAHSLSTLVVGDELVRAAKGLSLLKRSPDGTWRPRLNPAILWSATEQAFGERLKPWSRTAPAGYLVTASLMAVREYVDVVGYLADQSSRPMHGLLARLILSALFTAEPDLRGQPISLVVEGAVARSLGDALTHAIDPTGRRGRVVERLALRDIETNRPLSLDTQTEVACFVSAVGSGQTLRQLMGATLRQGYRLRGALALLDTRSDIGAPIALWGREYWLSAVLDSPLEISAPSGRAHCLSTNGLPEKTAAGEIQPDYSRSIDMVAETTGLVLGHFRGTHDNHYTFGLSLESVLASERARNEVMQPLLRELAAWHTSLPTGTRIQLSSAAGEDNPGGKLFWQTLIAAHNAKATTSQLRFEARQRKGHPQAVLSVDWGAVSGRSILNAVTNASMAGAHSVLVLRGFSIMDPDMEEHVRSLHVLKSDTRVSVEFSFSLPIDAYTPETCPLCVMSDAHLRVANSRLRDEARRENERIAIRDLSDEGPPEDSSENTSHPGAAAALHRRAELLLASRSTGRALECQRELEKRLSQTNYMLSLCTLIMFEPQWLRRAPLAHPRTRSLLAQRIVEFLLPVQTQLRESRDVENAIVALRLVSKLHFADNLDALLTEGPTTESFNLVCHLTNSIMGRRYVRHTGIPDRIEAGLIRARGELVVSGEQAEQVAILDDLLEQVRRIGTARELASLPAHLALLRFGDSLTLFSSHDFRDPLDNCLSDVDKGHYDSAAVGWERVNSWLRSRTQPAVDLFYRTLRETHELANHREAFDSIFGDQGTLGRADEAANIVRRAARGAVALSQSEVAYIRDTTETIRQLVVSAPSGSNLDSRLSRAVAGSAFTVHQISGHFFDYCKNHGVRLSVEPTDEWNDAVVLPDRFLHKLIERVADNTTRLAVGQPTVSMGYRRVNDDFMSGRQGFQLTLTSIDTRREGRDPHKEGVGGIAELDALLPHVSVIGDIANGSGRDDFVTTVSTNNFKGEIQ